MFTRKALPTILAVAGLCTYVSLADYVDPPGWDTHTDFTHQTWEFNADDLPLVADGGYSNPFGDPTMTEVYLAAPDYMTWTWENMAGGTRYGLWGGMAFGVDPNDVAMSLTFEVPNYERSAPWQKDLWLQVAYWGSIAANGEVLIVEIAGDPEFQDLYLVYEAVADDIENQSETGSGSTGQFWRFTHTFALDDQPGVEYVRLSLIPADSMAVFFDQVSMDTRGRIPGDLDGDGDVDLADLAQLLGYYGTPSGASYEDGDIDGDGDVDLSDLAELLGHYGSGLRP